MMKEAYDDF
jgi:phospholipid-translocating ATPase